jgi:hypothetical protein
MKKRPRTGKRVAMLRTSDERIVRTEPALRVIGDELWEQVKESAEAAGARRAGASGLLEACRNWPGEGRPAKYLLSGSLKVCGVRCGFRSLERAVATSARATPTAVRRPVRWSISVPRERAERGHDELRANRPVEPWRRRAVPADRDGSGGVWTQLGIGTDTRGICGPRATLTCDEFAVLLQY